MSDQRRTTTDRDTERRVADWLAHGPDRLPEYILQDVIQQTAVTRQARRRRLGRWRDRDEGVGRTASEWLPGEGRTGNLLMSLAGLTALLAVLALSVGFARTSPMSPAAGGSDLVVAADGSGDHTTIAEAIAAADPGAVVAIRPGWYEGSVVVDKDIHLLGDGAPDDVIIVAPAGAMEPDCCGAEVERPYALLLQAGDVSVTDLTIETPAGSTGIAATSGNPLIERVSIVQRGPDSPADDGHYSMGFYGPTTPTVRDSTWDSYVAVRDGAAPTFEGNTVSLGGLSIDGPGVSIVQGNTFVDGAWVNTTNAVSTVTGNTFIDGDVSADVGSDIEVRGNTFRQERSSSKDAVIAIRDSRTRAVIEDNTVESVTRGVSISAGASASVSGNDIESASTGIVVSGTGDVTVQGNTIRGPGAGIVVVTSAMPTITGNTIAVGGTGISVAGGAAPVIDHNSVCSDDVPIHLWAGASPELGANELCGAGQAG
jgi:parallel beta-helix repeat protein